MEGDTGNAAFPRTSLAKCEKRIRAERERERQNRDHPTVQETDTWRRRMRQTHTTDGRDNKARKWKREALKGFKFRNPLVFNVWGDIKGL